MSAAVMQEPLLSEAALNGIRAVLATRPQVAHAWLYGSRAKGNARPGSDIDLCLEGASLTHADLLQLATALDDLNLPWRIDLSLLHQIDNPELLDHIHRVGIDLLPRT